MQNRKIFWRATLAWGFAALALSPLAGFAVDAGGGDQVYTIDIDGHPWRVHVFTTVGTNDFTVGSGGVVEYLIVGGGGGGNGSSGSSGQAGAGGGAGGFRTGTVTIASGVLPVVVGDGGLGVASGIPNRGQPSSFAGIEAAGGGGGGGRLGSPQTGGSGGGGRGANSKNEGASGNVPPTDPPQGHDGGAGNYGGGGGGGGAGEPGHDATETAIRAGDGGDGKMSNITGTPTYYAGGGGGGGRDTTSGRGLGGNGGGGNGGDRVGSGTRGQNAQPHTGGGGGGSAFNDSGSGRGGSGIVVIRYPLPRGTILIIK